MGLFSSKGKECWVCRRKADPDGQFLTPEDLKMIFADVFDDFKVDDELQDHCLCKVCAGILKYATQDSVQAKIRINEASDALREKFGFAKAKARNKLKEFRKKDEEQ